MAPCIHANFPTDNLGRCIGCGEMLSVIEPLYPPPPVGTEQVRQLPYPRWAYYAANEIHNGTWPNGQPLTIIAAIIAKYAQEMGRRFPCQNGPDVPYEVMAPHESMMKRNHSQTVERLSERGGLSPCEAWMVVNGITWSPSPTPAQITEYGQKWREYAERVNLHYDELERLRAILAKHAQGEQCVVGRAVISKPGAALEVAQLELSDKAKAGLSTCEHTMFEAAEWWQCSKCGYTTYGGNAEKTS